MNCKITNEDYKFFVKELTEITGAKPRKISKEKKEKIKNYIKDPNLKKLNEIFSEILNDNENSIIIWSDEAVAVGKKRKIICVANTYNKEFLDELYKERDEITDDEYQSCFYTFYDKKKHYRRIGLIPERVNEQYFEYMKEEGIENVKSYFLEGLAEAIGFNFFNVIIVDEEESKIYITKSKHSNPYPEDVILFEKQEIVSKDKIQKTLNKEIKGKTIRNLALLYREEKDLTDPRFVNFDNVPNKLYTNYPLIIIRISFTNGVPLYAVYNIKENKVIELHYKPKFLLFIAFKKYDLYKLPLFTEQRKELKPTRKYISYKKAKKMYKLSKDITKELLGDFLEIKELCIFGYNYYASFEDGAFAYVQFQDKKAERMVIQPKYFLSETINEKEFELKLKETIIHEIAHVVEAYLQEQNFEYVNEETHNKEFYEIMNFLTTLYKNKTSLNKKLLEILKEDIKNLKEKE